MDPPGPLVSLLEYARFQSSRLKVDFWRESRGCLALGSSLGIKSSSSSGSGSFAFGFSTFFGFSVGAAFGFSSFFLVSLGGGVYVITFSRHSMVQNLEICGWLRIVSTKRTIEGYFAMLVLSKYQSAERKKMPATWMSATVKRSPTRKVLVSRTFSRVLNPLSIRPR